MQRQQSTVLALHWPRQLQNCDALSSRHSPRHPSPNLRLARPRAPAPCRAAAEPEYSLSDWRDSTNPLSLLPACDGQARFDGKTYVLPSILHYVREGSGSLQGRPALIKSESYDLGTDASCADRFLNEVRVYQRLAHLQGRCIPVLVGAGKVGREGQRGSRTEESVFLATDGCQRLGKGTALDTALQWCASTDVSSVPRDVKWAALDSLRQLHDAGVLHGRASSLSLFVQTDNADRALPRLLWGDFGASSIMPGMNRHWPAAQEEAFLTALEFGLPEWNHQNLLTSAAAVAAAAGPAQSSLLPHERPVSELLPAFDEADMQFSAKVRSIHHGELMVGAVRGQPAMIKLTRLRNHPIEAAELLAEVKAYRKLAHLQGSCIPAVIASGSLHEGCTGFIATADAGTCLTDLVRQRDTTQPDRALTEEEEAEAFEALACIHDGGVVHGDPNTNNLMIQRTKDGFENDRVMWIDFGFSRIVPGLCRGSAAATHDTYSACDFLQPLVDWHEQLCSRQHASDASEQQQDSTPSTTGS